MRTKYSRLVAVVMAITAGGLAAFALRPAAGNSNATLAARNPAIEVRTQVIRRTIHVIRHEPGARLRGSSGSPALVVSGHGHARTAASGKHGSAHGSGTSASAAATRASGAHAVASGRASSSAAPVATRSSGSHTSASPATQGHPVSTRSSGAHGGASSGGSTHPVTRSSGGGHGHGEDGGDGGSDG